MTADQTSADPRHVREARYLGHDAALSAATWLEMSETDATSILEDIDPAVLDQYAPPNLSGEWAGDPTRDSLTFEVTGLSFDFDRDRYADAIAEAWEEGVSEAWPLALEAHALRVVGRITLALAVESELEQRATELR